MPLSTTGTKEDLRAYSCRCVAWCCTSLTRCDLVNLSTLACKKRDHNPIDHGLRDVLFINLPSFPSTSRDIIENLLMPGNDICQLFYVCKDTTLSDCERRWCRTAIDRLSLESVKRMSSKAYPSSSDESSAVPKKGFWSCWCHV